MKWFPKLFGSRAKKIEGKDAIWGYAPVSSSGVIIGEREARSISTVYACCRVLCETVGSVPLILYRRLPGGGKERAVDHELYSLLHDAPNAFQTSINFRELLQNHLCLRGNGYAQIVRDNGGMVRDLIPLAADRIEPKMSQDLALEYEYTPVGGGPKKILTQQQVLHIKGLSSDGLKGLSVLDLAKDTFGLAITQDGHAARYFSQGATPSLIVRHPKALGEVAYTNLKKSLQEKYSGVENANKLMLIEEGMDVTPVTMTNEQSQMIQARKFSVSDICRWFRVPPHMVGDLERATFSNIEQQSLEFIIYTMTPWFVRWEQALNQALLSEYEREEYFFGFLVDGLLRGDIKTRYDAYATGRQWGWLSVDDIREFENMNPLPDGKGKVYLEPLNMKPAGTEPDTQEPASDSNTQGESDANAN